MNRFLKIVFAIPAAIGIALTAGTVQAGTGVDAKRPVKLQVPPTVGQGVKAPQYSALVPPRKSPVGPTPSKTSGPYSAQQLKLPANANARAIPSNPRKSMATAVSNLFKETSATNERVVNNLK